MHNSHTFIDRLNGLQFGVKICINLNKPSPAFSLDHSYYIQWRYFNVLYILNACEDAYITQNSNLKVYFFSLTMLSVNVSRVRHYRTLGQKLIALFILSNKYLFTITSCALTAVHKRFRYSRLLNICTQVKPSLKQDIKRTNRQLKWYIVVYSI